MNRTNQEFIARYVCEKNKFEAQKQILPYALGAASGSVAGAVATGESTYYLLNKKYYTTGVATKVHKVNGVDNISLADKIRTSAAPVVGWFQKPVGSTVIEVEAEVASYEELNKQAHHSRDVGRTGGEQNKRQNKKQAREQT